MMEISIAGIFRRKVQQPPKGILTRNEKEKIRFDLFWRMGEDPRREAVREERMLTVHTIVSLLKAWKVTIVGLECDAAAF